jgi:alkyl hydroperoxide reductase subunit AhpC
VNCRNVIPQLRDWHAKYERDGLTVVGVHSPEFAWVRVRYPVVQDNDFAIWRRYANWAWPSAVIVDRKGVVRYTHVGEGGYRETEEVIRRLLAEP